MKKNRPDGMQSSRDQYKKLYQTARWKKLRKIHLAKSPYCVCPHHQGQRVKAEIVDHIKAHKGDTRLFWNPTNLQSLTKYCHDRFKQSEEKGGKGFDIGCDAQGNPANKLDHW